MAHQIHLHPIESVGSPGDVRPIRRSDQSIVQMGGIGPGLRTEVVLGKHRHSGAHVPLQHRNVDDVVRLVGNRIKVIHGHGDIARISLENGAFVGVGDGGGRAGNHDLSPQVSVTAVVEIMDVRKLPMPRVVEMLVDVLQRIADVNVRLIGANDIDQLAKDGKDRADGGLGNEGGRGGGIGVGCQVGGVEISRPGAGGIDLDEDLLAPNVVDRSLAERGIVEFENGSPSREIVGLTGQAAEGGGHHAVDDSLVVVDGEIPGGAGSIHDATLVDRGGIMDPNDPPREDSFGLSNRLIGHDGRPLARGIRRECAEGAQHNGSPESGKSATAKEARRRDESCC